MRQIDTMPDTTAMTIITKTPTSTNMTQEDTRMNLIVSERAATRLAIVLAAMVLVVVLFAALRPTPDRVKPLPADEVQIGCALVLTTSGHECR
jgi:hypothetical protein